MSEPLVPLFGARIGDDAAGEAGEFIELIGPYRGDLIGRIVETGKGGVDRIVKAAGAAFAANRKRPAHERIAWLQNAAAALDHSGDRIARLICEDVGKPIRIASGEVKRGVEFLRGVAAALTQFGGEMLPLDATAMGAGRIGFVRHVPYGVVAAITPFNAPVNLLLQKVAPAIAAGNAVVAKPAPAGARTALQLADMFQQTGWPQDLFAVATGHRETALALAAHEDVQVISLTGGGVAGDALARAAGMKKILAELGSNAANVVMADADIDDAAKKIAAAAFEASGQQCISAQRVLVDRMAFDAFVERFVAAAKRLRVGDPSDPNTDIGPMVSQAAAQRVMEMCDDALRRGARYALRPDRSQAIVSPGILVDVGPDARLWREEVFGPIAVVAPFETTDEALRLANDSPFGLQGAVFTRDLPTAMQFSDDFAVGSLWINEATRFRLDIYPFGGMKRSGVGREGIRYAIEEFSQRKFTGIAV